MLLTFDPSQADSGRSVIFPAPEGQDNAVAPGDYVLVQIESATVASLRGKLVRKTTLEGKQ
jgi:hypothetical protein